MESGKLTMSTSAWASSAAEGGWAARVVVAAAGAAAATLVAWGVDGGGAWVVRAVAGRDGVAMCGGRWARGTATGVGCAAGRVAAATGGEG